MRTRSQPPPARCAVRSVNENDAVAMGSGLPASTNPLRQGTRTVAVTPSPLSNSSNSLSSVDVNR